MNKRNLNIFIGFIIAFFVVGLILRLLPYFLLAGCIAWIGMKIYGFFRRDKEPKEFNKYEYTYENEEINKDDDLNDVDTSKAIDVDYKEL